MRQLLRDIAYWILSNVHPSNDEVDRAILNAFSDCGLPLSDFSYDLDISHKFYEVLFHTCKRVGINLRTVKDLKNLID